MCSEVIRYAFKKYKCNTLVKKDKSVLETEI